METIIARLLDAFEKGALDRRELIRNLAVAATGAGLVGRAEPLAGSDGVAVPKASFRTASLDHISYAVADYGRSRDFYADLMGWEVVTDNGENQATLRIGPVGDIIIRNNRRPESVGANQPGQKPLSGVINHVAWKLEHFETDAVRAELEGRGLNPRRDQGGGDGYDSYHVLDPDGWDLQIS